MLKKTKVSLINNRDKSIESDLCEIREAGMEREGALLYNEGSGER